MFGSESARTVRPLVFCFLVLACLVPLLMLYLKATTGNWPSVHGSITQVTVMVWKSPFGSRYHLDSCESLFGTDGCHFAEDGSSHDGGVFHYGNIGADSSELPEFLHPSFQHWVWMNTESPSHSKSVSDIEHSINLIAKYRQNATIFVPYGSIVSSEGEDVIFPNKRILVCWISDLWNDSFASMSYYNELKNHIEIYTAGKAFHKPVSHGDQLSLISSCKFYLSFENSMHQDYVTEQLYNPLMAGTVPVVLGPSRQNYDNFVPGDAIIHVNDFFSPKDLADFLLMLGKYDDMYRRYFLWRKYYKVKLTMFGFEWE